MAICPKLPIKYSNILEIKNSTKDDKSSTAYFINQDKVFEVNANDERGDDADVRTSNKVSPSLNDKSASDEAQDKIPADNHQPEEAPKVVLEASVCNESVVKENGNGDNVGGYSEENSRGHDLDGTKKLASNASNASKKGESTVRSGTNGSGEGGDASVNHKKEVSSEGTPRLEPLKDYEFDASNLDDVTYQKLSSKGKESVFAKLKNRIKNLETNLNLTNRLKNILLLISLNN